MRRLLCVILLCVACDRQPPKPANVAPATNSQTAATAAKPADAPPPTSFPDTPPDKLPTTKLPVTEPLEFGPLVDASPTELATLDEEGQLCWELFADEDRIAVTSGTAHSCRRKRGDDKDAWTLFATDTRKSIYTFDRLLDYSSALDMIEVQGGQPEEQWTVQVNPTMTSMISSDRIPVFVDLETDAVTPITPDKAVGYDYRFVDGAPLTIVTKRGEGHTIKFAVVEGVPISDVPTDATLDHLPRDKPVWDAERKLITYPSMGCFEYTISRDGSESKCTVKLADDLVGGNVPRKAGDWLIKKNYGPDRQTIAIDLTTGDQSNPAEGTCEKPIYNYVDSKMNLPRLLVSCADEGQSHLPKVIYLWTPQKRVELLTEPWRHDRAFGHFVSFEKSTGRLLRGGTRESIWLDLRRFVFWDPGHLYLAGDRFATNARPLDAPEVHEFFLIDDDAGKLQPLDRVQCPSRRVHLTHRDDEVVSVVCTKKELIACGRVPNASVIDFAVTWDLRTGKRFRTQEMLVGVTKSTLLFTKTPGLSGGKNACEIKQLATLPR